MFRTGDMRTFNNNLKKQVMLNSAFKAEII